MPVLAKLVVSNLRNIQTATLRPVSGFNLFFGRNGSGKTSVLEAAHLLGLGRSFRGHVQRPLVSEGQQETVVFGETQDGLTLGIRRPLRGQQTIHLAGRKAESLAELSQALPVQLLNSDTLRILEGSPQDRRRFLDWGVFHVEHGFFDHWRRARAALQQRNVLLRQEAADAELEPWTLELLRAAALIDQGRAAYLACFRKYLEPVLAALLPAYAERLQLDYARGWSQELALEQVLASEMARDRRQGFTASGPHRAELRLRCGPYVAADVLSRGQLKLLVCALKIAQARLLQAEASRSCVFLIDDLPAELDNENRALVCQELSGLGLQVFMTAIELELLQEPLGASLPAGTAGLGLFHVKHGIINPM